MCDSFNQCWANTPLYFTDGDWECSVPVTPSTQTNLNAEPFMHQTPTNQSALLAGWLSQCNRTELKAPPDDEQLYCPKGALVTTRFKPALSKFWWVNGRNEYQSFQFSFSLKFPPWKIILQLTRFLRINYLLSAEDMSAVKPLKSLNPSHLD